MAARGGAAAATRHGRKRSAARPSASALTRGARRALKSLSLSPSFRYTLTAGVGGGGTKVSSGFKSCQREGRRDNGSPAEAAGTHGCVVGALGRLAQHGQAPHAQGRKQARNVPPVAIDATSLHNTAGNSQGAIEKLTLTVATWAAKFASR